VSTLNVLKSIIVECMEILESFGWISLGLYCILEIAWKLDAVKYKYKYKYKSEQEKGIDDADFGEVQLTVGDAVITEKGINNTDKDRFYLPKNIIDKFDGRTLWLN
jgi:hypothetical protein